MKTRVPINSIALCPLHPHLFATGGGDAIGATAPVAIRICHFWTCLALHLPRMHDLCHQGLSHISGNACRGTASLAGQNISGQQGLWKACMAMQTLCSGAGLRADVLTMNMRLGLPHMQFHTAWLSDGQVFSKQAGQESRYQTGA